METSSPLGGITGWNLGWATILNPLGTIRLVPIDFKKFAISNGEFLRTGLRAQPANIHISPHRLISDSIETLRGSGLLIAPGFLSAYSDLTDSGQLDSGVFEFESPCFLVHDRLFCLVSVAVGEFGEGTIWVQIAGEAEEVFFSWNDLSSYCDLANCEDIGEEILWVRRFPANPTAAVKYCRFGITLREWMEYSRFELEIKEKLEKNIRLTTRESSYYELIKSFPLVH